MVTLPDFARRRPGRGPPFRKVARPPFRPFPPLRSSQYDLSQTPMPQSNSHTNATRVKPVDVIDVSPAAAPQPKRGDRFGGFTLVDELGRGAFGRVFLATEHNLADRLVALKVT